ncbi:MAG: pre-peptidase C-terminal domain-containing protein [Chloroflexi bacterium]|nr:pre-peptidase C-terminal domain-containing protein [Chloroflexota bacterium]
MADPQWPGRLLRLVIAFGVVLLPVAAAPAQHETAASAAEPADGREDPRPPAQWAAPAWPALPPYGPGASARSVRPPGAPGGEPLGLPASTAQQAAAAVAFTPTVVAPGGAIQVSGTGFTTGTASAALRLVDLPAASIAAALGTAALAAGAFGPTSVTIPSSLPAGGYRVQATNGVVTATSAATLTVAAIALPVVDTLIVSAPMTETAAASATFAFSSTAAGATFECALDRAPFASCPSPISYHNLAVGAHHFEVRAVVDRLADATPATWGWRVVTATAAALPDLVVTSFAASATVDGSVAVTVTVSNVGAGEVANGFWVHLFADRLTSPTITEATLVIGIPAPLSAGASVTLTAAAALTLSAGTHTLWAVADGRDDVREADERNNALSVQVAVAAVPARTVAISSTSIGIGQTALGALSAEDDFAPLRGTGTSHLADRYTFGGTAGQVVAVDMASAAFDAYLFLYAPDAAVLSEDDDGGAGTDARIPAGSGFLALPTTGVYTIEVTSFAAGSVGSYTLTLSAPTPRLLLPDLVVADLAAGPARVGQSVPVTISVANQGLAAASAFHVHVFADRTTPPTGTEGALLALPIAGLGAGVTTTVTTTLASGLLGAGAHSVWALADGGGAIAETDEANNSASINVDVLPTYIGTVVSLSIGDIVTGTLSASSARSPERGAAFFAQRYTFGGAAGLPVAIALSSAVFDTYLYLFGPTRALLAQDDDGGGGTDSRVPPGGGLLLLPSTGVYTVEVTSFAAEAAGVYTLALGAGTGFTGSVGSLSLGEEARGILSAEDGLSPLRGTGTSHLADRFTFSGTTGQHISAHLSAAFDAYLYLLEPGGAVLAEDDDGGGSSDARIPSRIGFLTLPATGVYTVEVTSLAAGSVGAYTLTLSTAAALRPDVTVTGVEVTPARLGSSVAVTVTVANIGQAQVDNALYVHLFVDRTTPPSPTDQPDYILSFWQLEPGTSGTLMALLTENPPGAGVHTVWAVADLLDYVAESNEANNTAVATFTFRPDLVVAGLEAEVSPLDASAAISATVSNLGLLDTEGGFDVHLFADAAEPPTSTAGALLSLPVGSLAAGASATVTATLVARTLSPGSHVIWLLADGANAVVETDETNNVADFALELPAVFAGSVASLSAGQMVRGSLGEGDGFSTLLGTGTSHLADRFSFFAPAGQPVIIELSSGAFDTYLSLSDPSGVLLAEDDDGGAGTDSRVPAAGRGFITLPTEGVYVVEVSSYAAGAGGDYTLTLSTPAVRLVFVAAPVRGAHAFGDGSQPILGIQPVVAILGTDGLTVTADSSTVVTLEIKAGTGAEEALLACDQGSGVISATVLAGVARFSGCAIDRPGPGYAFQATADDVSPAEAPAFNVTWAGDTVGDCRVSIADYSLVVTHFGKSSASTDWGDAATRPWRADLDGDLSVDVLDHSIAVTRFGTAIDQCAAPSGP